MISNKRFLSVLVFTLVLGLAGGCADTNDFDPPVVTPPSTAGDSGGDSGGEASGGETTDDDAGEEATTDNTVSGSVIKGPVSGAVVIALAFDGITELGRAETNDDGTFTVSIGDNAGGVLISATGGTYTDEASGAEGVPFGSTEMRAAYTIPESMNGSIEVTINVTPFTEIAVRNSIVGGVIDPQLLADANEDFFGLGDDAINILTTLPTNPLTDSVSEGTAQDLYGLYIAAVSQIIADQGLAAWDQAVDLLDTDEADALVSAALTALGQSDSAAGANVSLDAATAAIDLVVDLIEDATGSGDDGSGADDGASDGSTDDGSSDADSGSDDSMDVSAGEMICPFGTVESIDFPSGLAGASGDLTLSFVTENSGLTQGTVQMFTFSSSGALFIDNSAFSSTPYGCGGSEIFWYNSSQDQVLSLSFNAEGAFNEVNVNSSSGAFLGQYTDENGDFSSVTNTEDSDSSGESDSDSGGIDVGDSGVGGSYTLTITGTVAATTAGITTTVDLPEITIDNLPAPDPDSDFTTVLNDNGFTVNGSVTVTVINDTADRVTFRLEFEGSSEGFSGTYDLTYDYQR